jgi:hypothetical protein
MSSSDTPKTILLRGTNTPHSERVCAEGSIKPGMLVMFDSQGRFKPHDTAAGATSPVFACESSYTGGSIDADYVQHDTVPAWHAQRGDQVYALLDTGQNVAAGALLNSAGDGSLQSGTTNPVARALEAVNNSGGSTHARIKVEVL